MTEDEGKEKDLESPAEHSDSEKNQNRNRNLLPEPTTFPSYSGSVPEENNRSIKSVNNGLARPTSWRVERRWAAVKSSLDRHRGLLVVGNPWELLVLSGLR